MTGFIESNGDLIAGRMSRENGNLYIGASPEAPISIGSYCAIAANVSIISANHDVNYPAVQGVFYSHFFGKLHPGEMPPHNIERSKGPIKIGNDVWIGEGAIILSGVTIGDGSCIGAKSVVTKSIQPYTINAGNPCSIIRNRYRKDVIDLLTILKWWTWDDERIKRNEKFFYMNLNNHSVDEILASIL